MATAGYWMSEYVPAWHALASIGDWWGLSLPLTLVLCAVLLMVVDFFFQSDILTHIAYLLLAFTAAYLVPLHLLLRVLVGIVAWMLLVYVHYSLWREFASRFVNHFLAPTKLRVGAQGLIGKRGVIKEIDGRSLVSVEGDLWSYDVEEAFPPGTQVKIVGQRSGILKLRAIDER